MDVDDVSIDTEALQAQIDLSMAFAQDLINSWIKPSFKTGSSSRTKLEDELKEYMRRPPRLGVGAPIPESANASRDAARLKHQLTKNPKKRSRGEEDVQQNDSSENDEESRASAIRKPSGKDTGVQPTKMKKRRRNDTSASGFHAANGSVTIRCEQAGTEVAQQKWATPCPSIAPSDISGQKARTDPPSDDLGDISSDLRAPSFVSQTSGSEPSATLDGERASSSGAQPTFTKITEIVTIPVGSNSDRSITPLPSLTLTKASPPKNGVLNLNGPPNEDNHYATDTSRKKRRRRKKRNLIAVINPA